MRTRDWYFQGWERREDEHGKSTFVYTGEYYTLPADVERPKTRLSVLTALLIGMYCSVALYPSAGGMWRVAAIPQLLELIPMIYLVIGDICLIAAKQPMTFRAWYTSWRRIGQAALWSLVICAAMAAVEVVYLITRGFGDGLWEELAQLFSIVACAAWSVAIRNIIQKHPCTQSIGTEKE